MIQTLIFLISAALRFISRAAVHLALMTGEGIGYLSETLFGE